MILKISYLYYYIDISYLKSDIWIETFYHYDVSINLYCIQLIDDLELILTYYMRFMSFLYFVLYKSTIFFFSKIGFISHSGHRLISIPGTLLQSSFFLYTHNNIQGMNRYKTITMIITCL